jgi:hypothetical protein
MRLADLDAILRSDLPCAERMVLIAIASHINANSAVAWPSIDTIAKLSGMHRSSAVRIVRSLKDLGWITVKKRFSKSAVYAICHKSQIATSSELPLVADCSSSSRNLSLPVVANCDSNQSIEPSIEPSNDDALPPIPDDIYFDLFWKLYDNKKGRALTLKLWTKIRPETKGMILDRVPAYVKSTPDPKYRKHPATYLRGQHWEDELPAEAEPEYGTAAYWNFHATRLSAEAAAKVQA